jgi:cyclic pyranopterin phosphate synthase
MKDADQPSSPPAEMTHIDESGKVDMVDVGSKPVSKRRAVAEGTIHLDGATISALEQNEETKTDVIPTARVGAVQAVKHTWEAIPMCHQIPVTNINTNFAFEAESVRLQVTVETTGQTGCEMEALQGVTTGLNVVWDMVKALEKDDTGQYPETRIDGVQVVTKEKREL